MKFFLLTLTLFTIISCTIEPEAISYGKDNCQFCKMTIMDSKFACEIVSKKGKIFKFDDLSCMIKYMKVDEKNDTDFEHVLVNQYEKPNNFIEISEAYFLSSQKYQSPMMGNTAAFINEKEANELQKKDSEAKKYTWTELVKKF